LFERGTFYNNPIQTKSLKAGKILEIISKRFANKFAIRLFLFKAREYFIAKDIAELLGYANSNKAIIDHCKKATTILDFTRGNDLLGLDFSKITTPNNYKSIKLIPESDVWRLIIKSRLPEAEKIEEWIMEEVLPSIRKTGSYSLQTSNEPDLELIRKRTELIEFSTRQLKSMKEAFLEIGISEKNELAITSNRAVAKETGIDFIQLAELKGLEAKEKFYSVTELCEIVRNSDHFSNEFKISVSTKNGLKPRPQNLNLLLEFLEFQFRENGEWKLTKKGEDFGKLSQNKSKYSDKTVYHLVWSKRVLELLK
jgi:prophage antirepressor-like protein